jgi:hypothetical protein
MSSGKLLSIALVVWVSVMVYCLTMALIHGGGTWPKGVEWVPIIAGAAITLPLYIAGLVRMVRGR